MFFQLFLVQSDSSFLHDNMVKLFVDEDAARKDPMYRLKSVNAETRDVLTELEREYKPSVRIQS